MKNISRYILSLFFLFSLLIVSNTTYASSVDYQVTPIPSEFQADKNISYFDLKLSPSSKEIIGVKLKNNANHPIIIDTNVDHASTNSNGVVEYKNSRQFKSVGLKNDLSKIVTLDNAKVVLQPKEEKIVQYKITMPDQEFDGVLAGGINFTEEISDNNSTNKNNSMAIQNKYGYTIALVLHGRSDEVTPVLKAGHPIADQVNGRNIITFPIENNTATFINQLNINAQVKKYGEDKIIYEGKLDNGQQAPNSIFDFSIDTKEQKLLPGKYTINLEAESKGKKWNFEDSFTIKNSTASKLNKTAVIKDTTSKYQKYIYIGIGALIFLLALFYYVYKKNQKIKLLVAELNKENTKK